MRVRPTGVIVLAIIVLMPLAVGGVGAVVIQRVGAALFGLAVLGEAIVNMVRHRNTRFQSHLAGLLADNVTVPAQGLSGKP